jgi:glycerophosphoryl diester phosphodiesterase
MKLLFTQQKLNSRQWVQIFSLGAVISLLLQLVIIPIVRWGGDQLLLGGENPVVSITSGIRLVEQRPLIAFGVLVELFCITLVIDCLTIVWIADVHFISREIGGQQSLSATGRIIKNRWASAYWPSLLMFLAFLPLFSLCFRTPLLVAGRAPIIFLDYVTRNRIVLTIGVLLYLIILISAWRFKHALVSIVIDGQTMRQSVHHLQHGTTSGWHDLQSLVVMAFAVWLINGVLLLLLHWIDNSVLVESIILIIINTVAVIALMILLVNWQLMGVTRIADSKSWSALSIALLVIWLSLVAYNDYRYVEVSAQPRHVALISHRGVVDHNGVQNTIPVMQKTHRHYHPDLVEIDIHETKDHRWVVMHDENYRKLTGINKLPRQLTLAQATKLTAKENGYQARVASFDQYLTAAEKMNQRLLIEIKTTGHESPHYLQHFNDRYSQRLLNDHDVIQSMDYDLVKREQKLVPGLKLVYIQAYDVGGPSKTVGGINIEYSGINQHFVWQSHHQRQLLYGWTVNNAHVAEQLSRQGVDGIVTDRLPQMKEAVSQSQRHRQALFQLWAIINPLSDWTNWQNLASK